MDTTQATAKPGSRALGAEIIETLKRETPAFHSAGADHPLNLRIRYDVLDWIVDNVTPGMTTLETGCGYSSVIFAACGANHTTVSPAPDEHKQVRAWCQERGVPSADLHFENGPSESVLPALGTDPIDLMLIDGMHAFPWPFIDFFFTADRIRVGGYLMIDDIPLRSGEVLREFVAKEQDRWRLVKDLKATTIFEKIGAPSLAGLNWMDQPWGSNPISRWKRRLRRLRQHFRS